MTLDLFRTPVDMSDAGRHRGLLDGRPDDACQLAEIVQGVLLHQHVAPAYGVTLTAAQQLEPHIRGVEPMLDRIAVPDTVFNAVLGRPDRIH